jgi:plastocyanin
MKRVRLPLLAALVAVAVLITSLVLLATSQSQSPTIAITAGDTFFDPRDAEAAVGDTVVWTNTSGVSHDVRAVDGSWDSPILLPGDSFERVFDGAESVFYYCSFHGTAAGTGMVGTIEVAHADDPGPPA